MAAMEINNFVPTAFDFKKKQGEGVITEVFLKFKGDLQIHRQKDSRSFSDLDLGSTFLKILQNTIHKMGSATSCELAWRKDEKKTSRILSMRESCTFRGLDKFLRLALLQLPQDDAIKAVIANDIALSALVQFLALELLNSRNSLVFESIIQGQPKSLKFDQICQILTSTLTASFAGSSPLTTLDNMPNNRSLIAFTKKMFSEFLHSQYFNDWRVRENSGTLNSLDESVRIECTLPELEILTAGSEKSTKIPTIAHVSCSPDMIMAIPADNISTKNNTSIKGRVSIEPVGTLIRDDSLTSISMSVKQVLRNCDPVEVPKLMKCDRDGWLTAFLIMVETLPIGITLSSVSRERPGYPVIYLNKHFEDNSGHRREDVLGERFGFMQRPGTCILPHSEPNVAKASVALGTAQAVVVKLDISRRNVTYTSALGIKPIMDAYGNYKFVIGIHLEITRTAEVYNGYDVKCTPTRLEKLAAAAVVYHQYQCRWLFQIQFAGIIRINFRSDALNKCHLPEQWRILFRLSAMTEAICFRAHYLEIPRFFQETLCEFPINRYDHATCLKIEVQADTISVVTFKAKANYSPFLDFCQDDVYLFVDFIIRRLETKILMWLHGLKRNRTRTVCMWVQQRSVAIVPTRHIRVKSLQQSPT
eukprot:gene4416-8793_t